MKNKYTQKAGAFLFFCSLFLLSFNAFAQVGINTTTPADGSILDIESSNKGVLIPRVNITNLSTIAPITGGSPEGLMVYNTNTTTGPGFFYWDGTKWMAVGASSSPSFDSVSLTTDLTNGTAGWNNIPVADMQTLTFTARKTSALVSLSASGSGVEDALSTVFFRVVKIAPTPSEIIGGTNQNVQSSYFDIDFSYVNVPFVGKVIYDFNKTREDIANWSASFQKVMTGLTPGTTYTLKVMVRSVQKRGNRSVYIFANTKPESDHLTLSVIQ